MDWLKSGYDRFASVTGLLFDLELPSFDTVISNSKCSITIQCDAMDNLLVRRFISWDYSFYHFFHYRSVDLVV